MNITPHLLTFQDGSTVKANSWPSRRKELADIILPHEFGGMPPAHEGIDIIRRSSGRMRDLPGAQYKTYEIRTRFPGGSDLSLTLSIWQPPGDGPFPVLLDGDGCWRCLNDNVVHQILQRGNIAASVDR
ncbi:MAG: hypothetical protein O2954_06320, partial [bacterium]|nr:hypothetical protein [bacterium]